MERVMSTITKLMAACLAVALSCSLSVAQNKSEAESFPDRPIRIVVPFPAGGPTDILSRIIGQKISEHWGQAVIIENRPGANTGIAAQMVARAAPDGYTLLSAMDTTMVMNPASGASMPYDPFKDFAAVTLLAKNVSLLTVRAADGPKTVKELMERGKASKNGLNYGAGITITRLAGYQFAKEAGFKAVLIPYKGSSEVVNGLLSGSVDFIVDGVASSLPLIKSGKFRALAKSNNQPLPSLPELQPLSVAAGLPQLGEMGSWIGLVAPAGTPPVIVEKIRAEVTRIYTDPDIAGKLQKIGISAVSSTPAEFDRFYRSEAKHWTKVFKESPLKLN
jgi:tripartite-type tricarboxylate transporter receptor subunit TctC